MNLQEFIKNFEDIVMVGEGTVQLDTVLDDLEEWDSLSRASLLVTIEEELDLKLEASSLREVTLFSEIVELVKGKLEQ